MDPGDQHRGPAIPVATRLVRAPTLAGFLLGEPVVRELDPGDAGEAIDRAVDVVDRTLGEARAGEHVVDRFAGVPADGIVTTREDVRVVGLRSDRPGPDVGRPEDRGHGRGQEGNDHQQRHGRRKRRPMLGGVRGGDGLPRTGRGREAFALEIGAGRDADAGGRVHRG